MPAEANGQAAGWPGEVQGGIIPFRIARYELRLKYISHNLLYASFSIGPSVPFLILMAHRGWWKKLRVSSKLWTRATKISKRSSMRGSLMASPKRLCLKVSNPRRFCPTNGSCHMFLGQSPSWKNFIMKLEKSGGPNLVFFTPPRINPAHFTSQGRGGLERGKPNEACQ